MAEFWRKDGQACFTFSKEEGECLSKILNKYDSEKVANFASSLSTICGKRRLIADRPAIQMLKEYAEPMLNSFKSSMKHLGYLRLGFLSLKPRIPLEKYVKIKELSDPVCLEDVQVIFKVCMAAKKIEYDLRGLTALMEETLESWTGTSGRPKADTWDFCFQIAKAFNKYFNEMPTSYYNGTFYKLVSVALEAVGLPHETPNRAVNEALKKLKAQIDQQD